MRTWLVPTVVRDRDLQAPLPVATVLNSLRGFERPTYHGSVGIEEGRVDRRAVYVTRLGQSKQAWG